MNMKNPFLDRGPRGYYKPFATRTLVLVSLLLITLALIAITEYACRTIPNHTGIGALGNVVNGTLKRDLTANVERSPVQSVEKLESFVPILSNVPLSLYSFSAAASSTSASSSTSPTPTQTATGGYLSLGGGSSSGGSGHISITNSVASGGFLSPGDGSTATESFSSSSAPPSQSTTVGSPASNPASQSTSPPAVGGGNGPPSDLNPPAGAAPSNGPVNPVQQPTVVATAGNGGPTGTNSSPYATETLAGGANNPPNIATEAIVADTTLAESLADPVTGSNAAPTPVVVVSNGQTLIETPSPAPTDPDAIPTPTTIVSDGQTFVETPSPTPAVITSDGKVFTEAPNASATPIVVVSDGKTFTETSNLPNTVQDASVTPVVFLSDGQTFTSTPSPGSHPSLTPVVVVSDGHTYTETPSYNPTGAVSTSEPMKPIATVVNSTGTYLVWPGGDSSVYPQITLQQYVLVSFVPILLAVIYTIPFRILDRTIRELEPFYQLSQAGGALAEHSLCLDYMTSNGFITPFKAGIRGHGYMFWSSLMSLAVIGIAPLSSEALFVSLSGVEGVDYGPDIGNQDFDYASWGVYPVLARLIEGLLAFVAVLICFMIWYGFRRESGVYGEPLSIAGLATLFHSSPLLRGFSVIDSTVSNSELKKVLSEQRYKIGEFTTADYRACYGLLPADSESGFIFNAHRSKKGPYRLVEGADSSADMSSQTSTSSKRKRIAIAWEHIKEQMLYAGVLFLITGMLMLISYYHWSHGDIHYGFEHFMDSNGFGVRFMMTALGVLLKMFWSNLDQELRRIAPYDRLALSSASPLDSILVPTYMSPFSAIVPSLHRKHFLIALIAFLSILSEFLPICLANTTFSAATTQPAYEACNDISLTILIMMLLAMLFLIFRPRHHAKRLPRNPNTIASVLVYLAAQGGMREREGLLDSVKGMERMETEERNEIIVGWERTYALGLDKRRELRVDEDGRIERLWVD